MSTVYAKAKKSDFLYASSEGLLNTLSQMQNRRKENTGRWYIKLRLLRFACNNGKENTRLMIHWNFEQYGKNNREAAKARRLLQVMLPCTHTLLLPLRLC